MKLQRRWLAAAISGAVVAVSAVVLSASGVSAAGTVDPSITSDPNAANGSIAFYDATGNRIYSGSLTAPFASYAVASTPSPRGGTIKATLFVATPDHTKANSATWFNQGLTAASSFPLSSANGVPAAVVAAEGSNPAVAIGAGDGDLGGAFAGAVNDPTTGYDHIMQIRLEDAGTGKPYGLPFWASDVYIDTTAGTWTQLFPAPPAGKKTTTVSTISASPASPAAHGSTVTLTATVSASDSSHPAGSVHLFDGSTDKGAATFTAGTGAISKTDTPTDGNHDYTFVFTPTDTTNYAGATSADLSYTVSPAATATTTTLTATPASPSTVGDSVTLNAAITPSSATGSVQFKDGATALGSPVTVNSGTAALTTSALAVGTHSLTAVFTPTGSFAGSTSTALPYTVNAQPATATTTTLTVTPASPVAFGSTVNLAATVSPNTAAGTVQFFDGATAIGAAVPVSAGSASTSTSTLASGSHSLTAKFVPTDSAQFGTSTSAASALTVSPQATTTALAVTPASPVVAGSTLTLNATISPSAAAGKVQFLDGSNPIGAAVTVAAGKASTTTSTLAVGDHSLSATFTPTDPVKYAASTSTASNYTVQKPPPGQTTTGLSVTPAGPIVAGDSATLKAIITPAAATGTVTFSEGGTDLGTPVTVSGGSASLALTPGIGSHSYTAKFTSSDASSYADSTSSPVTLVVKAPATKTATTLSVTPAGPVDYGTSVSFTATVSAANNGDPAPTGGSVRFTEGTAVLGTQPLTAGTATLTLTTLGGGDHSVVASYVPADATVFAASSSDPVSLTVHAQPTTTTLAAAGKVTVGDTVTLTATLDPASAAGSVAFSDGATALGTSPVSAGQAILKTTKLTLGDHSITAAFTPANPAAFTASASTAVAVTVVAAPELGDVTVNGQPISAGSVLTPGETLTLNATGFQPGETVKVILRSAPVLLATTTADPSGNVSVTVTLPANLAAGSHTLTLQGSLASTVFAFKVAAAVASGTPAPTGSTGTGAGPSSGSGGLASTGAVVLPALGLGGLLLLAGAGLLIGSRRGTGWASRTPLNRRRAH